MEYLITLITLVVLTLLLNILNSLSGKSQSPSEKEELPESPKEPNIEVPPIVEEPKEEIIPEVPKVEEPKEEVIPEAPKEEPKVEVAPEVPKVETPKEEPKIEVPKPTKPKAEKRKVNSNQIKVLIGDLRIRVEPMGEILGYADKNGYYTYTSTTKKDNITWYILENGSCIGDAGDGDLAVCKAGDYMIFPLKQFVAVTTEFSKSHTAVDFGWNRNYGGATQAIVAPYDMKIVSTGYSSVVGNYIYAQATYEGLKYTFRFIHLSSISVKKGDSVKRGTTIAKMGDTGSDCYGAHLHFDILKGHRTSLPSDRYANSYDAMKMCYATSSVTIGQETAKEFTVLKA